MKKVSELTALQSLRYNHEKEAKKRFVSLLKNPTLKQTFEQGLEGEHRIVVIGRSGVGKTTLILKLLGAKNPEDDSKNNLTVLAKYIRGSTVDGGAGTSTVFRYKISKDTTGCIKLPEEHQQFIQLSKLKIYLSKIRENVENGKYQHKKPISIELPCQYFYETQNRVPWVITDLPGIDSNTKSEHKYVNDLIHAFILNSNVFLIVEIANNIGQLKSLTIPGYGTWQNFGRRCRLIISHAFSKESFKRRYRNKDYLNSEELLSYYKKELGDEKGLAMEGIDEIFPLEYGDSWGLLRKNEKNLFKILQQPVKGVEGELLKSIDKSLNFEEEYLSLMDLPRIMKRVEKEKKDKKKKLSSYNKKKSDYNDEIELFNKKIIFWQNEKKKTEKDIANLKSKQQEFCPDNLPLKKDWEEYKEDDPQNHDRNWRNEKNKFINLIKDYSKNTLNDREEIEKIFREKSLGSPFDKRWRDYSEKYKDSYYEDYYDIKRSWKHWLGLVPYKGKNSHAKDDHAKAVHDGVCDQYRYWIKKTNEIVTKRIEDKENTLKNDIISIKREINRYQKRINYRKKEITTINKKMEKLKRDIKNIENTAKEDESNYCKYQIFRTEELNKAVSKYLDKARKEKSPGQALQYLAFCYQIILISKSISNS